MSPLIKLIPFFALLQGCTYFRSSTEQPNWNAFDRKQLKEDIQPLEFGIPYRPTESIQTYFKYYDLNLPGTKHYFGTVESENETLVVHVYLPENPRGSLFLLHGYFDHTGTLAKLIHEGVKQNYAIVVWDLPGHGLSSGIPTDTGEFELCAKQLNDIVTRAEPVLPRPFHLIAHSTGCSITLADLYDTDDTTFEKIVFLAPLIRHTHWGWAKFGYTISKPFTKSVRRRDKKNSSDEDYLAFVKQDPLHSSILSYEYLGALYHWEKKTHAYPEWPGSLCVIQGTDDDIVDWNYNLEFLQTKIAQPEIHMLPEARHQLLNEKESIRKQVLELIFNYLNTPTPRTRSLKQEIR
ncbi:alpha/beta hydrolase [Pontiellaceae bacterium B1224]|nr:alpha/beta hydrolase [Pontiellaceae bacterium B1224]